MIVMAVGCVMRKLVFRRHIRDTFSRTITSNNTPTNIHSQSRRRQTTSIPVSAVNAANVGDWQGTVDKQVPRSASDNRIDPAFNRVDLSFENAEEAYKSRTNGELLRTLFVMELCGFKYLIDNSKQMMKLGRKFLGKQLFEKVMKLTVYGQFVAGENMQSIQPVVEKNIHYGVKSILDYCAEKDITREEAQQAEMESCISEAQPPDLVHGGPNVRFRCHREFGDRRDDVVGARTYFYEDEAQCDTNMMNIMNAIDAVSGTTKGAGFAAVKLTSLGRPQLLLQLSEVLSRVRRYYDIIASTSSDGRIHQRHFERYLKFINLGREERKKWFTILDITQDGEIDLLDWHNLLEVNISLGKLLRVPNLQTGQFQPLVTAMTEDEEEQTKNMLMRIDAIAKYSKENDVRIMIDAEQSYFQMAINRLTMELMRKYNKEKAIVFNTYQCYLKDAFNMISTDLSLSKREDFYYGAKLVRGAYMDQERKRAQTLGYESPINPTFEATTAMFERVIIEVMERIQERERGKIAVMMATQNEDTIRFTLEKMNEYNIKACDKLICFGQLLGMCDQVSFTLGQSGYSVYKYVPYGPVDEVLPYLSRRVEENQGLFENLKKEKTLIRSEWWRRIKNMQWFYRPPHLNVVASQ